MSLFTLKTISFRNLIVSCFTIFCFSIAGIAQEEKEAINYVPSTYPTKVIYPTNFFVSKPVRDLPVCDDLITFDGLIVPKDGVNTSEDMSEKRKRKLAYLNAAGASSTSIDPLIQGSKNYIHSTENRAPIVNFESLGLNVSPPDPSMAVGPNHIVTMENGQWAVYDKMGNMASGFPKLLTDPLSAPGSTANSGDPVVMYDREADRWFISQFQLPGNNVFLVGVSTTADPTGAYNVYEYNLGAGNDYPHYGVWGDSYVTAGNFTGAQKIYTFNRAKMLSGDGTAEIVGFSPSGLGTGGFAAPIPVHSEGAGAVTGDIKIVYYQDDAFSGVGSDHIGLWNIDMDWSNIPSSTISGKNQIPTAAFDAAIAGGFSNLQQPGTGQRIDAIIGAVMNMSHWYQFGTHESILLNWVVETVDGTRISGIRWVELRSTDSGASWSVYQEGTFTDPTGSESVFMGCISMDSQGNIGLGYTKTGSTTFPSLYYTGRMDGDVLGSMTVAEELAIAGTTSVTANDRYGDYGQAVRDPSDDLTFWVTSEYSGDPNRRVRVYSFKIAPTAPQIGFSNTASNATEDANLCFTDINIPLNISSAPSSDATVNFVISGASTASTGLDFELVTPNVTFDSGLTTSQDMVLRVFHDGLVESDETVIVDFTVSTVGDAEANLNSDSFMLTIASTDLAPVAAQNSTLFAEDFESYTDFDISPVGPWTMLDNDGDQAYGSATYDFTNENYTGTFIVFNPSQTSPSAAGTDWDPHGGSKGYYCFAESIAPFLNDDYIFTPQISLNGAGSELKFWARSLTDTFGLDRFEVGVSTTDTNPGSFTIISSGPYIEPPIAWTEYTYDLSAYDGGDIYISFHVVSSDSFVFMLDDISVTANTTVGVQTAVNSGTSDNIQLNGVGTGHTYDDMTGDVMVDIVNGNSHDYDCVDIYVSRSGTSAQSYNGSVLPDFVMDKTFDISPTITTGSGSISATFYFTEAEVLGWEMATGDMRTNLVAARGNASSVTETTALTIGSFGGDVTLTGNFTGLDGTFYFGPSTAFTLACAGSAKVWDGANWSGGTPPTAANTVTIDGLYDTNLHGNIEGCSLTVNVGNQLTVRGGDYVRVNGNIIVDGSLIIEHQGSVVQTDAITTVTNNGTINVLQTTPNLGSRDFMILGSPMTGETRTSV
ncbi:MAG: choice-of-anchor J domain-containing protein, partial [Flavobacteriaceae bacterium]|nr:choice-of-anchor J domain-containing protein [Flavobacteriaceae bacterium]